MYNYISVMLFISQWSRNFKKKDSFIKTATMVVDLIYTLYNLRNNYSKFFQHTIQLGKIVL